MACVESERPALAPVKILVTGPPGAGVTSFISAFSDVPPVGTSEHAFSVRTGSGIERVVLRQDYGRRVLFGALLLSLFGVPLADERFVDMRPEWLRDAVGAVVVADSRALTAAAAECALLEEAGVPSVVAVNLFPGGPFWGAVAVRARLGLRSGAPVVLCDARSLPSVTGVLAELVRDALEVAT